MEREARQAVTRPAVAGAPEVFPKTTRRAYEATLYRSPAVPAPPAAPAASLAP